jgi:hypothetical protein
MQLKRQLTTHWAQKVQRSMLYRMTNFLLTLSIVINSMASDGQSLMQSMQPEHFSGSHTNLPRRLAGAAVFTKGYFSVIGFLKKDLRISPSIEPIVMA